MAATPVHITIPGTDFPQWHMPREIVFPWLLVKTGRDRSQKACADQPDRISGPAMIISLDIDCTPDELRAFFGLPDVKPMQEHTVEEGRNVGGGLPPALGARMPRTVLKTWLPAGLKGVRALQACSSTRWRRGPGKNSVPVACASAPGAAAIGARRFGPFAALSGDPEVMRIRAVS